MKLGDKKQAQQVTGRNLQQFTERDDIVWAIDACTTNVEALNAAALKGEIKAVLMTGNEDAPDEVWIARETPVLITTEVELVHLAEEPGQRLRCKHCNAWIDTALSSKPIGETSENAGTESDPRAPGDHDDICAQCNYGKGLRGGPNA